MQTIDSIVYFVLGLILIVAIFMISRGVILWYYRINDRIKNQETIIELLKKIAEK